MKKVIGYYNALEYRIELDGVEVYTAGNSPHESQTYVTADMGVGLRTMRSYCITTSKALAKEHNAEYVGVEKIEA